MSALEQVLSIPGIKAEHPRLHAEAETELASLREQLATAERERDEARAQLELADRLATLTPRRCGTCAQEAARKMLTEAAQLVEWEPLNDPLISQYWLENSNDRDEQVAFTHADKCAAKIRALPLPSCDGCNPLKPEDAK